MQGRGQRGRAQYRFCCFSMTVWLRVQVRRVRGRYGREKREEEHYHFGCFALAIWHRAGR